MTTEGPSNRETQATRRADFRATARVPVTVRALRTTAHGLVLDVSASGARLFMDDAIDCGGEVLLHWLGHDVCAEVAWSRQFECRVRFTRQLDPEVLAELGAALAGAPSLAAPAVAPQPPEPERSVAAPVAARRAASLTAGTITNRRRQAL